MSGETTPTTAEERIGANAFHQPGTSHEKEGWCQACHHPWSCMTSRLIADVARLEGELKIANHQIECFVEDRDKLERELGRREKVLEAIIIRCEEGDKRTDWLPTIARIACAALAPKEPGEKEQPLFDQDALNAEEDKEQGSD